jgi:hypothetical protein
MAPPDAGPVPSSRARLSLAAALAAALAGAACGARELPELPPSPGVAEPSPDAVESVLFFVGDPGKTRARSHPVLRAMRRDVERWAGALGRDTAVVVAVMGDIVYPDGLHAPGDPAYHQDSLHVASQVGIVEGPAARASAVQVFVAGNHDWGREEDWEGTVRLGNLDTLLEAYRREGIPVSLEPGAGTGGPTVLDVGRRVRLVFLDTAWWLLDAEATERAAFIRRLEEAFRTAGDREVILTAHHPYQSAGSHGGFVPLWRTFGVRYALARSGAILQDLNSRPYRRLLDAIRGIGLRHGPALLFAGGHDHSLQVIRDPRDGSPRFSVVAGSASKLTDVGHVDGMLFRRSWPGYVRVFVLRDGGVILSVEGAEPRYLECSQEEAEGRERCLEAGADAYRTLWSDRIR